MRENGTMEGEGLLLPSISSLLPVLLGSSMYSANVDRVPDSVCRRCCWDCQIYNIIHAARVPDFAPSLVALLLLSLMMLPLLVPIGQVIYNTREMHRVSVLATTAFPPCTKSVVHLYAVYSHLLLDQN